MTTTTTEGTARAIVLAEALLVTAALSFIFSGFYKGLVPSPVDLTAITAALTCAALLPFIRELDAHRHAATWLLVAVASYLALRLLPDLPAWGLRKLAETVLFGAPAFLAGYVIARRVDALQLVMTLLAWSAVPLAIVLSLTAAVTNPYTYQWIGSSGYQLTGLYMGLALIAAATSNRYVCFGFAALGIAVAGNLTAALFAPAAVLLIWWTRRKLVARPVAAALALLVVYTALVAPPLVIMRVLWKVGAVENTITHGDQAPRFGGAAATSTVLKLMPKESEVYLVDTRAADRIDLYKSAVRHFAAAPIFGHGYGALRYVGDAYPHNALLELLAEGGIVAGLLLVAAFATARPPIDDDASAFAAGCLLFLIGWAMVSGYFGNRVLLFCVGMATARRRPTIP